MSLIQRVAEQTVRPMRALGLEFAFAKYRPSSCTLALPLELYPPAMLALVKAGSGYEYTHDDGVLRPELYPTTERLRPHPEELSMPCTL